MDDSLDKTFRKYTQMVKLLPNRPTDNDLLILYGFYKQATIGDCNTPKPKSIFDMKETRKWNTWKSLENLDKESSMRNYINKVNELYHQSQ